jgi:hypothetical protein
VCTVNLERRQWNDGEPLTKRRLPLCHSFWSQQKLRCTRGSPEQHTTLSLPCNLVLQDKPTLASRTHQHITRSQKTYFACNCHKLAHTSAPETRRFSGDGQGSRSGSRRKVNSNQTLHVIAKRLANTHKDTAHVLTLLTKHGISPLRRPTTLPSHMAAGNKAEH